MSNLTVRYEFDIINRMQSILFLKFLIELCFDLLLT